jgi:hypothetical protein
VVSRIRVRGSIGGATRGGRIGQVRGFAAHDVVIEGVDMNGQGESATGGESNQAVRDGSPGYVGNIRWAFINCRMIAGAYGWLGTFYHVAILNCTMYAGAATRAQAGIVEGWALRMTGGPIAIVDSRIQTTRYTVIRTQSSNQPDELCYIGRSTIVGVAEGRALWMWNDLNNPGVTPGLAQIVEDCDFYTWTSGGCGFGFEITNVDLAYSRIRRCRFFNGGSATASQSTLNSIAAGGTGSHDYSDSNTFLPLPATEPAWPGPGDPRLVPLPNGWSVIAGESPCPGLVW